MKDSDERRERPRGAEDAGEATELSPEAFDAFLAMLEAPMPPAMEGLLSRKPAWEQRTEKASFRCRG